jgi:hypothetical protein
MLTKTRTALISLVLAATATPAVADDPPDPARELMWSMLNFKRNTTDFADQWGTALDESRPEGSCHAALEKAKAGGIEVTDEHQTICDEFKKYHQLAEAQKALQAAQQWNFLLTQIDKSTSHEEGQANLVKTAAACTATLDRLSAAGMPMDIKVTVRAGGDGFEVTMKDAKAKVCDPLTKAASTFAKDVSGARAKAAEAAAAPFKKLGVTGERLSFLASHFDYYAMYGVGGNQLRSPQQLKSAKVIFELLGPNTATGRYTLRRYQFNGDKLVSTTERDFIVRPGAKFFK